MTQRVQIPNPAFQQRHWDLNQEVLWLNGSDSLSLGDFCESCLVTGGIGSGKTTGAGTTVMRALLIHGAGMCCLAAKQDEYARIYRLCSETGRLDDLVYFAPGERWRCDVLDVSLHGPGASVEAAGQLIDILIDTESRNRPQGNSDPFWRDFAGVTTRQEVTGVWLAHGHASLSDVHRFITSAPQSLDDVQSDAWANRSYCAQSIAKAKKNVTTPEQLQTLRNCADYFMTEWPNLADKTRTSGQIVITTALSKFLSGPLHNLLSSGETNLHPNVILDGKIVVLGMPPAIYHGPGRFFQVAYKTLFQRAALARDIAVNSRPVVLWQDEVQNFLNPGLDLQFQTMGRQSRLITVSLGHSLPVLYAALGGSDHAKHEIDGWVANHMLKVLHANSCHVTNEFFSNLFGKARKMLQSGNMSHGEYDLCDDLLNMPSKTQLSSGWSENWEPVVQPSDFTRLSKGGALNRYRVEAFLHAGGKCFSNGQTYLPVVFHQGNKHG